MPQHRNRRSSLFCIDSLEHRRMLSRVSTELAQEPITIGVPGLKDITFVATNGRKTTISVSGASAAISFPGPAALTLYQGHAFFPAGQVETISSIVIANAIPGKATLKEVGAFGTGLFNINSIVGGDLAGIIAPDVNLTGSLSVGSIGQLKLGQASAAINLGASASMVRFTGPLAGSLTAGSIGTLTASSISYENITTTAAFSNSNLAITRIDGGTGILNSNIISTGSIGSVKAGFLQGTVITAATTAPAVAGAGQYPSANQPISIADITHPAAVHAIVISSTSVTSPAYFSDSIIAAETIGSMTLGQIDGGGGVTAETVGSLNAMGPSGELDRFPFHLGPGQLKNASKLHSTLTHLNIPFVAGTNLPQDTVFYNFNLDLLI